MMSHTPVKNSGAQAAQSPQTEQDSTNFEKCHICSERKDNKIECLIIVKCNHSFHRACIENFLSDNNACPVCNLSCELSDLKRITFSTKSSRSRGAKSRGAQTGHQYTTRSTVQPSFQDTQTTTEFTFPNNASNQSENFDNEATTAQNVNETSVDSQNVNPSIVDYAQINKMIEVNLGRALKNFKSVPQQNVQPTIDYNLINKMIETNVSKIFQNLNLTTNTKPTQPQQPQIVSNVLLQTHQSNRVQQPLSSYVSRGNINTPNPQFRDPNSQTHVQQQRPFCNPNSNLIYPPRQVSQSATDSNLHPPNLLESNSDNPTQSQDLSQSQPQSNPTIGSRDSPNLYNNHQFLPSSFSSNTSFSSDKLSSIIQNWGLKFDGTSNGLYVEEFLYRLRSLINDYFNGDFNFVRPNLHIVLAGKAKNWFWSYHKRAQPIIWEDFCNAIKDQYKDFKSPFDIREEIRNRKQKPGESFDMFYESISSLIDRLPNPLSESELVEIITRNLRPDIRHELLYQPSNSISNLRKLVQMRESFLNDEYVRRNFAARNPNTFIPRRQVAEIDFESSDLNQDFNFPQESSIEAVHKPEVVPRCWNCDQ
ncbi:hypothetical protein CVS40_4253 [Lucilia cuprina]|nr:hypothetical protein CVS40_4253 [Lucilia cuprina]